MKAINRDMSIRTVPRRYRCLHSGVLWFSLTSLLFLVAAMTAAAGEDHAREYPGLGKPRILFVVDGDWTSGSWRSLAFTHDSKSLVGTLVRNSGSAALFLLGQRLGEVRSFDLTTNEKPSAIVMAARDMQYEILQSPSGTCREPLVVARWDGQPKEIEVVALRATGGGWKETLVGRFPVPRADKMSIHTASSVCVAVTPVPEMLVLGTGCMKWEKEARSPTWWGDVRAWDLQAGKPRFADAWEGNQVLAVACSSDGKSIAAGGGCASRSFLGADCYRGRLVCWDKDFEKKRFHLLLPKHQVHCLAFSPDGKTLVTGGLDGEVKLIGVDQGVVARSLNVASCSGKTLGRVETLAFSPNGRLLAAGVGSWNRGNKWGETLLIDIAKGHVHKVPSSQEDHVVTCVAFSPNGKYLAAGGMEGVLKLWPIDGEQ